MATALAFPSGCKVCPTCNRRFTAPKQADKKLSQDLAKAESAIAALERFVPDSEHLREAVESEWMRLQRALGDHALLWSIYRRSDKATGYGISLVKAVAS